MLRIWPLPFSKPTLAILTPKFYWQTSDAHLDNLQDILQEATHAIEMAPDNADAYVSLASILSRGLSHSKMWKVVY